MSLENFSNLIDKIAEFSSEAVISLSLWGEATLHPQFEKFIEKVLSYSGLSLLIELSQLNFSDEKLQKIAEIVKNKAIELRDSTDSTAGAILAVDYVDSECEKNPYNYDILMRYVQYVAHLSRFADFNNCFANEPEKWNAYVLKAINRGFQVIRYSNDQTLIDSVHFATAWIYIHNKEYDKAWEHINVLPSISSNQLREGISSEVAMMQYGKEAWLNQLRIDLQNFTRAINKSLLYASETYCFVESMENTLEYCDWAKEIVKTLLNIQRDN